MKAKKQMIGELLLIIVNIMKIQLLIFFQIIMLSSCFRTTGIDEFKLKYEWEISEAEYLYDLNSNGGQYLYKFNYHDKTYEAIENSNLTDWYLRHRYNYKIIFDTKNPSKNYLVLFEYPIIREPEIYRGTGKIKKLRVIKNKIFIKYETTIISPDGNVVKSINAEYLPLEYYKSLKKIKNSNLNLTVYFTFYKDWVFPWIDRNFLKE